MMWRYKIICLIAFSVWMGCCPVASSTAYSDIPSLSTSNRISIDGITWEFTESVKIGRFVNGDYYVVGPATVKAVTPKPDRERNGSVLNLPIDPSRSGFDSRVEGRRFDERLRANVPIQLKPGDALISSISVEEMNSLPVPLRPSEKAKSPVRSVSVLTCLANPVPSDAFRPSYCDREQKIFLARQLRRELLPRLSRQGIPFKLESGYQLTLKDFARMFERPWLEVCFFGLDAAIEYQPTYGREVGRAVGIASLLLCLDFTRAEKERLLIPFVQYGIDLWGIGRAGYRGWLAHGGHGSGRKWPIVFAGLMLGDEAMQSPNKTLPALKFSEDMQTMYGLGWTGAKALYAGHIGKEGNKEQPGWGEYEHLPPTEWQADIGESYRRCCTSVAWVGQALAARILQAEKFWDRPAFFDYVDRWMTEDDAEQVATIKKVRGWDFSNSAGRQKQAWDPFVNAMWARYRQALPGGPAPAGGKP